MATNNISDINIPRSPFLDTQTNRPSREWLMYLLKLGSLFSGYLKYGAFQDTTTQSATANTATIITFNTTDYSNGVTVNGGSRLTVAYAGTYNVQFSVQLQNTDTQLDDVSIWLRVNGTDVVGSTGLISVPNKHGGVNGHSVNGWNYFLQLNANDYVQLVWSTSAATTTIEYYAPGTSPTRPATASVIATVNQITP
jgi:hypothetical protein